MKLPDKFTYSVEEIAKAWDCTVQDVLQYWVEDKLHLCIFIVPPELGKIIASDDFIQERGYDDVELSGAYYLEPFDDIELRGNLYRGKKYQLTADNILTHRVLVDGRGGYDEYYAFEQNDKDGYVKRLYNTAEMKIRMSDICITHVERVRFEQFCNEQSIDKSHKDETPPQRKARLIKRKIELKNKGVKDFNKQIAEEEGISVQRVKQLTSSG